MYEDVNPLVIALHGALVEMQLRVKRCEDTLGLSHAHDPVATFGREPFEAHLEGPCSCEESLALQEKVRKLEKLVVELRVELHDRTAGLARVGVVK
jgi:hypothetical protein